METTGSGVITHWRMGSVRFGHWFGHIAFAYPSELTINLETFSVKPTELEPLKQLHT